MLEFILYILGVVGCTFVVTQSYIFKGVRDYVGKNKYLGKLIKCPMCFGFWAGLFFYFSREMVYCRPLLMAFSASFVCYMFYLFLVERMNRFD